MAYINISSIVYESFGLLFCSSYAKHGILDSRQESIWYDNRIDHETCQST